MFYILCLGILARTQIFIQIWKKKKRMWIINQTFFAMFLDEEISKYV